MVSSFAGRKVAWMPRWNAGRMVWKTGLWEVTKRERPLEARALWYNWGKGSAPQAWNLDIVSHKDRDWE